MVTMKEYKEAPENALFVHKENKFAQVKTIFRFKLNQIADSYIKGISKRGGNPHEIQYRNDLKNILSETLEHFEIQLPKVIEDGTPAHFIKPIKHRSRDGKGRFCYKCGFQKEDTKIIEEAGKVMRVCQECLGI